MDVSGKVSTNVAVPHGNMDAPVNQFGSARLSGPELYCGCAAECRHPLFVAGLRRVERAGSHHGSGLCKGAITSCRCSTNGPMCSPCPARARSAMAHRLSTDQFGLRNLTFLCCTGYRTRPADLRLVTALDHAPPIPACSQDDDGLLFGGIGHVSRAGAGEDQRCRKDRPRCAPAAFAIGPAPAVRARKQQ